MPIFEFKCKHCNKTFEELVFSSNIDLTGIICPSCGKQNPEKLMSSFCSSANSSSGYSGSCGSGGFS